MKVEMFYIWLCAILAPIVFINLFTVTKTTWDVSYLWTIESMGTLRPGQTEVMCRGDLDWTSMKRWLEKNTKIEGWEDQTIEVFILATNKGKTTRYLKPAWRD